MKIGILTFYNSSNFGANLQGVSTYMYLKKRGHTPIMINYKSKENYLIWKGLHKNEQFNVHLNFVNSLIENQTPFCHTASEIVDVIHSYGIEAVVIGSDAVLQHHTWQSRLKIGGKRLLRIDKIVPERMFPCPFWGVGLNTLIPTALMSASSQNSDYKHFSSKLKEQMKESLSQFKYISVRDNWTQDMIYDISGVKYPITPDPVFAFNQNASEILKSREEILTKYYLPEKYVLVCLSSQSISSDTLSELKIRFLEDDIKCVAFPMPSGINFRHNFDYSINTPLVPNDWYSLIKYSNGYIGSNMHPIVVSLANAVPCFSIDNWGRKDIFNRKILDNSSKVHHIMSEFNVVTNHCPIDRGHCSISAKELYNGIIQFPIDAVREHSNIMTIRYNNMMEQILEKIKK